MLTLNLCICVVLFHSIYAADPPVMKVESDEDTCTNQDYVKDFEASNQPKDDKNLVNITFEVTQQIPSEAFCHTRLLKKDGDNWEQQLEIGPDTCCQSMVDSETYKGMMEGQDRMPTSCPIEPACEMHVTHIEVDCKNDEYIGEATVSVKEDGSNIIFNGNTVVVKALPEDVQCVMEAYNKDDGGNWNAIPGDFPSGPCCKLLQEHEAYKKFKDHPMVKDNCPAKEGSYNMENLTVEKKECDDKIPKGDYKVTFKSATPDGKCMYTTNTYVTVADQ
ncbi:hypothetical protein L9F63_001894 [Diploptera punctata]|uniref:Uncharacterized protein n=1 Tax=Diploptera punctata TaxID=6984 RepID=A0AAD8A3N7_DIPPU|nr:hypothetical protein L9F63_001894 [Diploptera punctata]